MISDFSPIGLRLLLLLGTLRTPRTQSQSTLVVSAVFVVVAVVVMSIMKKLRSSGSALDRLLLLLLLLYYLQLMFKFIVSNELIDYISCIRYTYIFRVRSAHWVKSASEVYVCVSAEREEARQIIIRPCDSTASISKLRCIYFIIDERRRAAQ